MNRNALISMIGVVLFGFILLKAGVSLVCHPHEQNSVAYVISSVVSPPAANEPLARPDPFSWAPVMNYLIQLISKACPA